MRKKEVPEPMMEKMALIAHLYYREKLSQQEIARQLHVSRPWVSKLLSRAEETGIVKIEITAPVPDSTTLEQRLKEKYHLKHIGVVDTSDRSRDAVAMAAVDYFVNAVRPNDIIGVGWGNAVSRFIQQLVPLRLKNTQTVPLAGSFGASFEKLPNYNAMQMAQKLDGTAKLLHVPAHCYTQEEHDTLLARQQTRDILAMGEHADLIVTGIGSKTSSFLTKNNILSPEEKRQLLDACAIGEIVLQFLTKDGERVDTELTRRLIRADLFEASGHARSILAFAEGADKVPVIHAALTAGLVNVFFTDKQTALLLLVA